MVRIEKHEVSLLAYFDAANPVGSVQRGGSVEGEGGDDFFNAEVHVDARQSNGERDGAGIATARIEIGSKRYGTTGVNHFTTAGVRLFEGESGERQQGGYHSGICHRTDSGIGSVKEMVGGGGAQFGGKFGSAKGNYLVGMEFEVEALFFGGLQEAAGLLDGENALLTEDVAKLGESFFTNRGEHLVDEEVDVFVGSVFVFYGQGVGSEKSGNDVDTLFGVLIQVADHLELPEFGVAVKTVAAFAFYGGDAHGAHYLQKVYGR